MPNSEQSCFETKNSELPTSEYQYLELPDLKVDKFHRFKIQNTKSEQKNLMTDLGKKRFKTNKFRKKIRITKI